MPGLILADRGKIAQPNPAARYAMETEQTIDLHASHRLYLGWIDVGSVPLLGTALFMPYL